MPRNENETAFLLAQPAFNAPPGANTTMTTHSTDQTWFIVTAVLCLGVSGLFLTGRIYTKVGIVKKLDFSDYLLLLGFPFMIFEVVIVHFMVYYGSGVHQWQVTLGQLFNQLHWINIAEIIYCPGTLLVKSAVLLQYLYLFAPSRNLNGFMFYGSFSVLTCCAIFYTVIMVWTTFYCTPRSMIWNKFTPNGTCHPHSPIVISSGVFNMVTDVVILLLPVRCLWRLNVPTWRKVAISGLFATGLLACIASVMRIVFTLRTTSELSQADVSYNGLWIALWSEAEIALGFVCACSMSIPRLLQAKKKHFKRACSCLPGVISSCKSGSSTAQSQGSTFGSSGVATREKKGYIEVEEDCEMANLGPKAVRDDKESNAPTCSRWSR